MVRWDHIEVLYLYLIYTILRKHLWQSEGEELGLRSETLGAGIPVSSAVIVDSESHFCHVSRVNIRLITRLQIPWLRLAFNMHWENMYFFPKSRHSSVFPVYVKHGLLYSVNQATNTEFLSAFSQSSIK